MYTYLKNFHIPQRMVVAGVGVDHQWLVDLAKEHFIDRRMPVWTENKHFIDDSKSVDTSLSQYTGGIVQVCKPS